MSTQTLLRPHNAARDARAEPPDKVPSPMPAKQTVAPGPTSTKALTKTLPKTWTEERVAQLESGIQAGLTCSQIAAAIGLSRNAVIGKMSRLGLSRRKKALASEIKPQRPVLRARSLARILARHQALMQVAPAGQAGCVANTIAILDGRGCSLFELTPGRCRWPINEPGAANFCFCGNAQFDGLPYCLGHARLAYKSTAGSA